MAAITAWDYKVNVTIPIRLVASSKRKATLEFADGERVTIPLNDTAVLETGVQGYISKGGSGR